MGGGYCFFLYFFIYFIFKYKKVYFRFCAWPLTFQSFLNVIDVFRKRSTVICPPIIEHSRVGLCSKKRHGSWKQALCSILKHDILVDLCSLFFLLHIYSLSPLRISGVNNFCGSPDQCEKIVMSYCRLRVAIWWVILELYFLSMISLFFPCSRVQQNLNCFIIIFSQRC